MNGLVRSLAFPVSLAVTVGALGLGLLIGLDRGEGEAAPTTPTPTQPSGTAEGEAVFESQGCGGCHTLSAANATGTTGPSLDETQLSPQEIESVVTNGRGTGMPSFSDRLSEEEIAAVAAYVSESAASP